MKRDCTTCKHLYSSNDNNCSVCTCGTISLPEYRYSEWEPKLKGEKEMAVETKIYTPERMAEVLKKCGQSIIENAESIIGSERYISKVRVTVTLNPSEAATINVDRDFYPEGIIK